MLINTAQPVECLLHAWKSNVVPFLMLVEILATGPAISRAADPSNLNDIPADLKVPDVTAGSPQAGVRVWQTNPGYEDWKVAHALYLPTDWNKQERYPVLFEYPGNGNFQNTLGDRCDGSVEACQMGYGLSGGRGMIWVSLPFVDPQTRTHSSRLVGRSGRHGQILQTDRGSYLPRVWRRSGTTGPGGIFSRGDCLQLHWTP